jgi:5-(carboxyamino)imidazole ribonucleotide mutase
VKKIIKYCDQLNNYTINYYSSAHKNTREVLRILDIYEKQNRKIVYVTVAGRSNALSGVVASNTRFPTIACPPFKDTIDFQVNINSTLICPSKVPVMTILEPENVAISINKIFKLIS